MTSPRCMLSIVASVFNSERFLKSFLENASAQTMFPEMEIVLVHNSPSWEEVAIVEDFRRRHPDHLQYVVVEREPLGASWNRGWLAGRGEYIAIWNVDDRRRPDSLERQVAALRQMPDAVLSYGDYIRVREYGAQEGERQRTQQYGSRFLRRAFPQGGAFNVYRRDLIEHVGYFDEQFKAAVDMEYSLRVAMQDLAMCRAEGLLGYFTDAGEGLSTREGALQALVERTAVQLRYAVYDKVRPEHLPAAREYRIREILNFGKWNPVQDVIPHYHAYIRGRRYLWALGSLRNSSRRVLEKAGLIKTLYALQNRYFKREI